VADRRHLVPRGAVARGHVERPFSVLWDRPFHVMSPVFNHVISSTFFCHFERSEKSWPWGKDFSVAAPHIRSGALLRNDRGAACFRTFVGNDKTRLSWRQKRSRLVVDAQRGLWKEMPRQSHNCSGNRSQGRCYCGCCSMTLIILSTVRLTGVGVMYFCPISTTFPANISTSVCLPASIS